MRGRPSKAPNVHCFYGLFNKAFGSWCPSRFQPTCGGCALISQLVPVQETSLLFLSSKIPLRITHLILKAGAPQSVSYCQSILIIDPLSTASSIIAVIQISGTVLSVCYRYAVLLENAPQDIQWVINEVGSLKVILEELKALALSVSDKQPGPSHKSLKRLQDDNDKAQHLTQLSCKARKVRLSVSGTPQDSHPISLERVEDQSSLVTCLEDSRIDLRPSGSSNSALFTSLSAAHGPLKTCEAALRAISDKLGPVAEASRTRKMLVWPFKANAVQKILQVIQKQKSNLILALASDEARAVSQMEDSLETNAEALLQIKDALAQNMEMMTEVRDVVQNKIERKEWEKMKQGLQSTDPGTNHRAAHEAHEPLTGNWLLESPDYCAWRAGSGALLWLNGISGCGKTVLSATVIEDVRRFCSTNPDNCYAYYYFDFNDAAKRKPRSMVSSLLGMLGCSMESQPQCIRDLHEKHLSGQQEPSFEDIVSALVSVLQGRRKVYILLDALDECLEQDRLLKCICTIESTCKNVSVFVSSRREYNITEALVDRVTYDIDMKTAAVDADIELFVQNFLSTDKALGKWPSGIRAEIKDELCRRSGGM